MSDIGDYIEKGYEGHNVFVPSDEYSVILDAVVLACVDVLIISIKGDVIIGKRSRHPQADWWLFGGRMRTGEHLNQAAQRLIADEVGLSMAADRFFYLTTFAAAWNLRAHQPSENGTHTVSVVFAVKLLPGEEEKIESNDEYSQTGTHEIDEIISNSNSNSKYHLGLIQSVSAYKTLINP